MKKTNKIVIIYIDKDNFIFEAPIFHDEQNCEYAKVNDYFFAIDTLKYAGYRVE